MTTLALAGPHREREWDRRAKCARYDPAYWDTGTHYAVRRFAKIVCSLCPVQAACLEYALRQPIPEGIWGGLSTRARLKLNTERGRAMNLEAVREHVIILTACRKRRQEIEELEANSRAMIEEALGESEIGELDGEQVVTWRHSKTRRLSQKLLKQYYPEERENCMETVESRTFRVES